MDAVKFIQERNRMCKSFGESCNGCPARGGNCCSVFGWKEELVPIVEEWSAAHPRETRQSVFLEQWPNANVLGGYLRICPRDLTGDTSNCGKTMCSTCKQKFWGQEVE